MKAVILAGGMSKRLYPATKFIGKSLLPIYNKPMMFYAVSLIIESGIKDITITCGENDIGFYKKLFENRFEKYGVNISFVVEKADKKFRGPAYGIYTAREACEGDDIVALFSDNVFLSNELPQIIKKAQQNLNGATVFLKPVKDPQRFGIVEIDEKNNMISMVEKPKEPKSNLAATGLMLFNKEVFERISKLKPSARGELETTDLINGYLSEGKVNCSVLDENIDWLDTGTYDSLLECSKKAQEFEAKHGPIGCPELSIYKQGKMTKEELKELMMEYPESYRDEVEEYIEK